MHVTVFIVSILIYWYSQQEMFLRWVNSCSCQFDVPNRIKQGDILSPGFFDVFINTAHVWFTGINNW